MERLKSINLTDEDFEKLKKHEVGHGTDGAVYRYGKYLIKVYHANYKQASMVLDEPNNDEDVKIYLKEQAIKSTYKEQVNYFQYDEDHQEDIRLRSKAGIKRAIERQADIKRSSLPKGIVFYHDIFAGCILQELKGIEIHKLIGLPFAIKRKIMKSVILDVKELMEYYIYHIDLDNSPHSVALFTNNDGEIENVGHSHVLVNPLTGETHLIDLDGKSTVYMERRSERYEHLTYQTLTKLLIEFLLGIDLDDYKDSYDADEELRYAFEQIGVMDKYIDNLVKNELTIEEALDLVEEQTHIKRA